MSCPCIPDPSNEELTPPDPPPTCPNTATSPVTGLTQNVVVVTDVYCDEHTGELVVTTATLAFTNGILTGVS